MKATRFRSAVVALGALSLVASTSVMAGASAPSAKYNAKDAALVPAAYKHITLQVASDATYAPDEFVKGTSLVGFDLDLMKAIGTTLGIKYTENNVTFDTIITGMVANKYQIGNSSFTDTKARQKQVNFVDYFKAGEGVYVAKNSKMVFKGLTSFCGHTVAVETGTVEQTDAAAVKCPAGKKVAVSSYATQTLANLALSAGHADFGFVDSQIAGYIVATTGGRFKLSGSAVNVAPYGIATQKNANGLALAKALQAALKTLQASGVYKAILAKWGVQAGAVPASQIVLNGATS